MKHLFHRLASTLLAIALVHPAFPARAEEEAPKKALVIPKSAAAAAYMLNRLSNKELTEAPRGEFVYVALLQRKGLDRKYRVEAIEGLAKARNTDPLAELIRGIRELDKKGEAFEPVLRELSGMLLQRGNADLAAKRAELGSLADEAASPVGSQAAWAGLAAAIGSAPEVWSRASADPAKLAALLLAVPSIRSPELRASFLNNVEPLTAKADSADVRRAAFVALAAIPGREAETFKALAGFIRANDERPAAVAALQKLPRKFWPADQAEPLLESLTAYLQSIPVEQRTEPEAVSAFQFASDVAALLPAEKAKVAGRALRALGVSVFVIRTVPEQMLYDKTLLVVEAGKPVQILLRNEDAMSHNLVVTVPGAAEEIGTAAEKMPLQPDSEGRLYVPDSPKVLHATKMLESGQEAKLAFIAPSEPGDYGYVCTFPGHWRRMVGTLAVVKDVEAYLASHAVVEPVITEWKLADLATDLEKAGSGRNLASGKETFTKLACAQCHKLGGEGSSYGPDLGEVWKQYKGSRTEVLRQILEPSALIADRYRNIEFELADGESVLGMILKETGEAVTLQTGPAEALIQTIKKADIKGRKPQNGSPMPTGLLNTLSKEQILDLLAWIEAGGKAAAHAH